MPKTADTYPCEICGEYLTAEEYDYLIVPDSIDGPGETEEEVCGDCMRAADDYAAEAAAESALYDSWDY